MLIDTQVHYMRQLKAAYEAFGVLPTNGGVSERKEASSVCPSAIDGYTVCAFVKPPKVESTIITLSRAFRVIDAVACTACGDFF